MILVSVEVIGAKILGKTYIHFPFGILAAVFDVELLAVPDHTSRVAEPTTSVTLARGGSVEIKPKCGWWEIFGGAVPILSKFIGMEGQRPIQEYQVTNSGAGMGGDILRQSKEKGA